jgi:branched-chain amino acid transport system substrate-binding protein
MRLAERAPRGASLLAMAAAVALALAACSRAPGSTLGIGGQITIGTLYASSGQFAASSMPEFAGLEFWAARANAAGGVLVGPLGRREHVRLIAYDDHSSPRRAARLYRRLIYRAHVQLLVSDFGSVLTAPAIPLAQRAGVLLFDQSGSGAEFFAAQDPYVVLCDLPTSAVWPLPLARLLLRGRPRVAIVFGDNYFDAAQDQTVAAALTRAGDAPVLNFSVPTTNQRYGHFLSAATAAGAQAVIEFGYQNNDIAFLRALGRARRRFAIVFSAFPGQLPALLVRAVGVRHLIGTYTYGFPPVVRHSGVNVGLDAERFSSALDPRDPGAVNFLDVAGYNTGLVIGAALRTTRSPTQLGLRAALSGLSGRLRTLEGTFRIDAQGAQLGEALPVVRVVGGNADTLRFRIVQGTSVRGS